MSFTVTGETSVADNVVNIAVVLDGSGSVGADTVSKEFVKNITAVFADKNLFANGGTASYVQFTSCVNDDDTGTFFSMADFNQFVDDNEYLGGGTIIDSRIIAGRELSNASPLASASFMFALIDGDGNIQAGDEADAARADGITVFAVGVGSSVLNDTLVGIGGSSDKVFSIDAFGDLEDAVDEILASSGTSTIACPATNAELIVEYGATVVNIISDPGATVADNTVTFLASDLEDNPTSFIETLDTCGVTDPIVPVVSITYSDDKGNSPDFTLVLNIADGSTYLPATSSPTPSPTSFMTFSPSSSPTSIGAPGTCSNGLVVVGDYGQCCVLGCGHCCEPGLIADDCCPRRISNTGMYCDIAGSAPCTLLKSTSSGHKKGGK